MISALSFVVAASMQIPPPPPVAPIQTPLYGKVVRINELPSKILMPRTIDVWLPDNYTPKKRYNVLYMHDGQMLFDASTTWNKQEWRVDETLTQLSKIGKLRDVIVVGVHNRGPFRHAEYYPENSLSLLPESARNPFIASALLGEPLANKYVKHLVTEVKPYIDANFATNPAREATFVAGSSMGGLISLYAICEYPEVFGGAACLSTHWPGGMDLSNKAFPKSIREHFRRALPKPGRHKIYFDYGDQTLDAFYPPEQKQMDETMKSLGWTDKNWITMFYPGGDHTEIAWSKRLYAPVLFLLGK